MMHIRSHPALCGDSLGRPETDYENWIQAWPGTRSLRAKPSADLASGAGLIVQCCNAGCLSSHQYAGSVQGLPWFQAARRPAVELVPGACLLLSCKA